MNSDRLNSQAQTVRGLVTALPLGLACGPGLRDPSSRQRGIVPGHPQITRAGVGGGTQRFVGIHGKVGFIIFCPTPPQMTTEV